PPRAIHGGPWRGPRAALLPPLLRGRGPLARRAGGRRPAARRSAAAGEPYGPLRRGRAHLQAGATVGPKRRRAAAGPPRAPDLARAGADERRRDRAAARPGL